MKCVVTGAAGYIGNVLVRDLCARGHEVTAFLRRGDDPANIEAFSTVAWGDVCDPASLRAAFRGAKAVIHLAGIIDIGTHKPDLLRKINVEGTRNVVEACRQCRVGRLVYASSVHALPELPQPQVMREVADFDPAAVEGGYAKTKAAATALVLAAAKGDLDAVVVHPAGIVGPFDYGVSHIGQLIVDFLTGRLTAYIDGAYSFVDVRDVSAGLIRALEAGRRGECYILSGGVMPVRRLIEIIADAGGRKMIRTKLPFWFAYGSGFLSEIYYSLRRQRPLYTAYSVRTLRSNCGFSSEKAERELGMSFIPLERSLREMTAWIIEHNLVKTGGRYKPRREK